RRKPEILHGAHRTIEIHIGLMRAPEHDGAGAAAVASDADTQRRLNDPLKLEPAIDLLPLVGEHVCGFAIRGFKSGSDSCPDSEIPDDDEIPRLHEANRRCAMRRLE